MKPKTTYHARLNGKRRAAQETDKLEMKFPVTFVTREDVAECLIQNEMAGLKARKLALSLSDEDMRELAQDLISNYAMMENFWQIIEDFMTERERGGKNNE